MCGLTLDSRETFYLFLDQLLVTARRERKRKSSMKKDIRYTVMTR